MPDICDLILDEHAIFRRRFAELDELHSREADATSVDGVWRPLAHRLERHADAEEEILYPLLVRRGAHGAEESTDAIGDHNEIRHGIRRASQDRLGGQSWWEAVEWTREANSAHMAEEERDALSDFRRHASREERQDLGRRWIAFSEGHAGGRDVDTGDMDPERYVRDRLR